MNHIDIEAAVRSVLGDPSREHLRISLVRSVVYPNLVHVYVKEDDQSILVRFTAFPALAAALGVEPSAILTKVVTTHEWSEADKDVKPHYDIEMSISGVPYSE